MPTRLDCRGCRGQEAAALVYAGMVGHLRAGAVQLRVHDRSHARDRDAYRPDGIFSNRWAGSGMCYCEHCRQNFKTATSFDLPRTLDPQDRARRAYMEWKQQRLFELCAVWNKAIREINPAACFIPTLAAAR